MPLEKKATDKLAHVRATSIMSATAVESYEHPLVTYMAQRVEGSSTETQICSRPAFAGFANGYGRRHPHLRNGLKKAHRYDFIMLVEEDQTSGAKIVVGAHSIPKDNFVLADMAAELPGRSFAPENAVVHIKADTGEIDIHVIPRAVSRHMDELVSKLEAATTIREGDYYECGSARFEVQQINGGEIIFDCRTTAAFNSDNIGRSGLGV